MQVRSGYADRGFGKATATPPSSRHHVVIP
jgi:hypothetical protein